MSEDLVKEAIIEATKEQIGEIYEDALKPATKESGEALQAIVGLFNNVVLYPIKKANITFRYKLEQFEEDLKEKTKDIPTENIVEPPLNIVGPTIESLKYTFDTDELREMYLNLLASSVNIEKISSTHPGYVEIIRQMSPLDARILKIISQVERLPSANIFIGFDDKYYPNALPNKFVPDLVNKDIDPFIASTSIDNLCRLGLLKYRTDVSIPTYDYEALKQNDYIVQKYNFYKTINPEKEHIIKLNEEVILTSDFGKQFIKACL